ncbi:hypothetical protein [Planomonospora algeriensis]
MGIRPAGHRPVADPRHDHRLRRALRGVGADQVLETRPGGYVALPGPARLDVQDFTELVAAGRFRDALELWNGDALADVHASYAQAPARCWTTAG